MKKVGKALLLAGAAASFAIVQTADAHVFTIAYHDCTPIIRSPKLVIILPNWVNDTYNNLAIMESAAKGLGGRAQQNVLTEYYDHIKAGNYCTGSSEYFTNPSMASPSSLSVEISTTELPVHPTYADESALVNQYTSKYTDPNTIFVIAIKQGHYTVGGCGSHQNNGRPYFEIGYQFDAGCSDASPGTLADGVTSTFQHELAETITDPVPYNGGWYSDEASSTENADTCEPGYGGAGNGGPNDRQFQMLPSSDPNHLVSIQSIYDVNTSGCVFSRMTRSDSFVLGTDYNLYHSTNTNGSWSSWGQPPVDLAVWGPAAVSHDPNTIDVFETTFGGNVWHAYSVNGGASATWENWGHPTIGSTNYVLSGRSATTSWGSNRFDVYTRGTSTGSAPYYLFHRSWENGVLSAWSIVPTASVFFLGHTPNSPPAVTSWGPNNIQLAYVDQNAHMIVGTSTDTSGNNFSWTDLMGTYPALDSSNLVAPAIGSRDLNSYDIYARDAVGTIIHYYQPNGGSVTQDIITPLTPLVHANTGPAIVGRGDQRFLLEYTGTDGTVREIEYSFGMGAGFSTVLAAGGTNEDPSVSAW